MILKHVFSPREPKCAVVEKPYTAEVEGRGDKSTEYGICVAVSDRQGKMEAQKGKRGLLCVSGGSWGAGGKIQNSRNWIVRHVCF